MITLILQDPPSTVIKGIQYLKDEGDLISYELSVNNAEYMEAHIIFKDFKGLQYIVALMNEKNKC